MGFLIQFEKPIYILVYTFACTRANHWPNILHSSSWTVEPNTVVTQTSILICHSSRTHQSSPIYFYLKHTLPRTKKRGLNDSHISYVTPLPSSCRASVLSSVAMPVPCSSRPHLLYIANHSPTKAVNGGRGRGLQRGVKGRMKRCR